MKRFRVIGGWFLLAGAFLCSCRETRSLEAGQTLYDGAKINIRSSVPITKKKKKELASELNAMLRPQPNSSFLGMRIKLWFYNIAGKPKGKGLRYLIRNKLGEPPVIASYGAFEKNRTVLQNRLENRGFFKDTVLLDTATRDRKTRATYTAQIGYRYLIRNVAYPADSDALGGQIRAMALRSLLKPGQPYDLDVIKNERSRIDTRLKQRGYYYFSPDDLLAKADSTVGDHRVDIQWLIKRTTPAKARETFRIGDVIVFADYDIDTDTSSRAMRVPLYDSYRIIDSAHLFKPSIFSRSLVFKPGDLYNRRAHDLSLNRLISLGVFKFVKVRFEETDTAKNRLNAFYYLTPTYRRSIRFEVSGLTKSDDANGGLVSVNWRNRNFFHGAELFTASVYGGYERQAMGDGVHTNTLKFGSDLNLYFPRIVAPFRFRTNGAFVPKTRVNLGYEFFDRTEQYRLNSFKTGYSYIWKENINKEHTLTVLGINYVNPTHINPAFQQQIDTNLTLARSIERQFVIGPMYNFNLNTQVQPNRKRNNFYFNANLDLSANLLGILSGADVKNGKERDIFGTPFSQYVRGEIDLRHYLAFSQTTVLATRLTGGLGYAYGNSLTMPFIKEFFAGGANDIRAFRGRALGPGTYYAGRTASGFIFDQPGDIKMELNAELRFKLVSIFRWAFFADAGNIWTLRADTSRPGAQFGRDFMQQMAVGVGGGLRVDISILLLRLDVGIPVREPYRPEGDRWLFDGKNLVFNFAIGYPL